MSRPTNAGLLVVSIDKPDFERIMSSDARDWQYDQICRGISEYGDDLVIATDRGVFFWNKLTEEATKFELNLADPRLNKRVRSVHLLENDTFLVTGEYGLSMVDTKSGYGRKVLPVVGSTYSDQALRLQNGEVVICSRRRSQRYLIIFDNKGRTAKVLDFDKMGYVGGFVESVLFQDSKGTLWVGSTIGLFEIDIQKEEILGFYSFDYLDDDSTKFPVHHCLSSNHIISLGESEGEIWVGQYDAGVDILNPKTRKVRRITVESGLNSNSVCALLPDDGGMWIGTFNGLAHYNRDNGSLSTFTSRNGLSHSEFNRWSGYVDSGGKYYIGTMNGITAFYPDDVLSKASRPRVLLSEVGFYKNGGREKVTLNSGFDSIPAFRIPSSNRSFYANVALSDMRNAKESSYRYRLNSAGQMNEWRNNGNDRQVRFEHLPAGVHELEITAVSASGISARSQTMILDVQEFIYLRWWFIVLFIVVVASIIALIYRYKLQQAIKVERLRTRLSSDLHDDVGGLLSGVAYQMELLDRTVDEKHKKLVRRVADSSRTAMVRMRDVIWAIDARNSTWGDLRLRMSEYANEQLIPLGIAFGISDEDLQADLELAAEVRHGLILIFKEFVTNSIKHAEASRVDVIVRRSKGKFVFTMSDNGKGSELNDLSSGQGLDNMRMRTAKMGGQIRMDGSEGFSVEIEFNSV